MNPQDKLRPLLESVQKNPEDIWCWMQLGDVAKILNDWHTAFLAYLAASRLKPDNEENARKFSEMREKYLESLNIGEDDFRVEVFKLPYHTGVILLAGILNYEIDPLQNKFKQLVAKGFKKIILDCSGLRHFSGYGPSCLRGLSEFAEKNGGKMALVGHKQHIKDVLPLKRIVLTEYPDIQAAFNSL